MNISIEINIQELVYDIQNKTYLTGRSRGNGENHRQVALMQANNDDENINQIMRSISNGFARINTELAEVLTLNDNNSDNTLPLDSTSRLLNLEMPGNFNPAATRPIADAIHQFIVANATAEWFMITNKPDTDDYSKLASHSLSLLREALCKRSRPIRTVDKE